MVNVGLLKQKQTITRGLACYFKYVRKVKEFANDPLPHCILYRD